MRSNTQRMATVVAAVVAASGHVGAGASDANSRMSLLLGRQRSQRSEPLSKHGNLALQICNGLAELSMETSDLTRSLSS